MAKASKATTKKATGWFTDGVRLVFELADADARDAYAFTLTREGSALRVEVAWKAGDIGAWTFTEAALDKARSALVLAQGSASSARSKKLPRAVSRDLPPFLLSRNVFAELHAGSSTLMLLGSDEDDEPVAIAITAAATLALPGLGEHRVLQVKGADVELWVVDDAAWPLVVHRAEQDDQGLRWLDAGAKARLTGKQPGLGKPAFRPFASRAVAAVEAAAGKGSDAIAAALVAKGITPKVRLVAIAKASSSPSPAVRDALAVVLGDADMPVATAAKEALVARARDADFATWLAGALSREQGRVQTSGGEPLRRAQNLADVAFESEAFRASDALAEACRAIARKHRSSELQGAVRRGLAVHGDEVFGDELAAMLDRPAPLVDDDELLQEVLRTAIARQPAEALAPKIDELLAAFPEDRRGEVYQAVGSMIEGGLDEGWARVFVTFWRRGDAAARAALARSFVLRANVGRSVFDATKEADVRTMLELFEHRRTGEKTQRALADVLLEARGALLARVVDVALEHSDHGEPWLFEALVKRQPASELAPLVAKAVLAKDVISEEHVDVLLGLPAKGWAPALDACLQVIDPDETKLVARLTKHRRLA